MPSSAAIGAPGMRPLGDGEQVLQAAQVAGERRPDQRILPGDLAAAHCVVFSGRGDRLMAEFLHGTQLSW